MLTGDTLRFARFLLVFREKAEQAWEFTLCCLANNTHSWRVVPNPILSPLFNATWFCPCLNLTDTKLTLDVSFYFGDTKYRI